MLKKLKSVANQPALIITILFGVLLIGILALLLFVVRSVNASVLFSTISVLLALLVICIIIWIKKIYLPITQLRSTISSMDSSKSNAEKEDSSLEYLLNKLKSTLENEYTNQLLKTEAEIHALQSQINPHFLYNTLETIRSQAVQKKVPEIAAMTEALATLFRYSISRPSDLSTLGEELANVESYFLIQQYRFRGRFKIIKKLDNEDANLLNYKVPVLTIQPIVENAIHHGLETKLDEGTVTIRAYSTQNRLIISVTDDGVGMTSDKLDKIVNALNNSDSAVSNERYSRRTGKNSGIALINVHKRIRFYFGPEYGMYITSTKNVGTSVEIQLPKAIDRNTFKEALK